MMAITEEMRPKTVITSAPDMFAVQGSLDARISANLSITILECWKSPMRGLLT
jgi:hypothetical protein